MHHYSDSYMYGGYMPNNAMYGFNISMTFEIICADGIYYRAIGFIIGFLLAIIALFLVIQAVIAICINCHRINKLQSKLKKATISTADTSAVNAELGTANFGSNKTTAISTPSILSVAIASQTGTERNHPSCEDAIANFDHAGICIADVGAFSNTYEELKERKLQNYESLNEECMSTDTPHTTTC